MTALYRDLVRLQVGEVRPSEPLSRHTSYRIGGPAEVMVFPTGVSEVCRLLRYVSERQVPYFILGKGTDLLCLDGGIPGVVVNLTRLTGPPAVQGTRLRALAGVSLNRLSGEAVQWGLAGLEFAVGIPGTLGGGVAMNAGAVGGEMAQVLRWARVVIPQGEEVAVTPADLHFAYRHTAVQDRGWVVVEAELELARGDPERSRERMRRYLAHRRATQPIAQANAGSVFKNPPGRYAAQLIEAVGGKGRRCGQAQISPLHANFIVNLGGARSADVLCLMEWAREEVSRRFAVQLEPEVKVVGVPA